MKATKLLYFVMLLLSVQFLCQTKSLDIETVSENSNKRYSIGLQLTSPDQKWTAFRKLYDEADTLIVVNHKNPRSIRQFPSVLKYYFTANSKLLLIRKDSAELVDPGSGTLQEWSHIIKAAYLKSKDRLVILTKQEDSKTSLEVWSENRLLESFEAVDHFFINHEQLFFTRSNAGQTLLYKSNQPEKPILTTDRKIIDLNWAERGESAWLEEDENGHRDLVYINKDGNIFRLAEDVDEDFRSVSMTPIIKSPRFFVTVTIKKKTPKDYPGPGIWSTDDRELEKKFHEGSEQLSMIWDPPSHQIKMVNDANQPDAVDIGNDRYFMVFDPYLKNDYVKYYPDLDLYRFDSENHSRVFLGAGGSKIIYGTSGCYFLSDPGDQWSLFDIRSRTVKKLGVGSSSDAFFSSDGQYIIFETTGGLVEYEIATGRFLKIRLMDGFSPTILNAFKKRVDSDLASQQTFDRQKNLLIQMYDFEGDSTAIVSYFDHKMKVLVKPTRQRIESIVQSNGSLLSYVCEDYNVPPYLIVRSGKQMKQVFKSNTDDKLLNLLHSERISYTNSEGVSLSGILYFPVRYDENVKYPMVVTIYQRQSKYGNQYLRDGFFEQTEGLNIRSYLEKSYFVFLPDIVFGKSGTGFSALDCVNRALDALSGCKAIDFKRIGLIGHSHGGYEVNFIATHSNRFAAYASGAGNSDIVRSYFSFNYNFLKPFYWQFEDAQYEMPGSFEDYKDLYISNSPIQNISKINAPILLWTGMLDKNIAWDQVMEFYIGLRRNKKEGTALFYPDEGHGFLKRKNRLDIAQKISEWFDRYLKDGDIAEWMMTK